MLVSYQIVNVSHWEGARVAVKVPGKDDKVLAPGDVSPGYPLAESGWEYPSSVDVFQDGMYADLPYRHVALAAKTGIQGRNMVGRGAPDEKDVDPASHRIRLMAVGMIEELLALPERGVVKDQERLRRLAIQAVENAAMWALKASKY